MPCAGLPRRRVLRGNVAVVAVGQHEHVKRLPVAGGRHRFAGGAQPGKHGGHVFVADGHDDGGARVGRQCVSRHAAGRERMLVAAQHDPKPIIPVMKPDTTQAESRANRAICPSPATHFHTRLHLGKQHAGQHRAAQHQQGKGPAAALGGGLPGAGPGRRVLRLLLGACGPSARVPRFSRNPATAAQASIRGAPAGRHAVGVAHFAQRAARSGGLRVPLRLRGAVG